MHTKSTALTVGILLTVFCDMRPGRFVDHEELANFERSINRI